MNEEQMTDGLRPRLSVFPFGLLLGRRQSFSKDA